MKYSISLLILLAFFACQSSNSHEAPTKSISNGSEPAVNEAHQKILEMIEKVGDYEKLKALGDVQYKYTYRKSKASQDVSIERYIFDGELSWAKYSERTANAFLEFEGTIVQGFNGTSSWMTIDEKRVESEKLLRHADFNRKTNFYWLTMMQKLGDPGLRYDMLPPKVVDDITYDVIKVTFNQDIGDVQDEYILFINPNTKLIDQFTFTVRDFGVEDPLLMKVKYTEHHGVLLPTYRKYARVDETGQPKNGQWIEEICEDLKFTNGFKRSLFEAPVE